MTMVCVPPRRAIKAWGAVIVDAYILGTFLCGRIYCRNKEESGERRERKEWEVSAVRKKVTRDLVEEDRANNPASRRSFAVSLRIVNRRCQEIREHFEARLFKHPSFECDRGLSFASYNYEHTRLYVFGHSMPSHEYLCSIDDKFLVIRAPMCSVFRKPLVSLCTSWHLYHLSFYEFIISGTSAERIFFEKYKERNIYFACFLSRKKIH